MADTSDMKTTTVRVQVGNVELEGSLSVPRGARGLVVFAHGSGSSRFSPRNQHVASTLNGRGLGTLLFDLLSEEEEELDLRTRELRFDIGFLAERVIQVTEWAADEPDTGTLSIGLFGSSTGAAAALVAAAERPDLVRSVVSRGGRPDLAGDSLDRVQAPTLLIVGGADDVVLELNREALERLAGEKKLSIVPGATHLFEEPGALDIVARLASEWFERYLGAPIGRLPFEGKDTEPLYP